MNDFLKGYAKCSKSVIDFKCVKVLGNMPLNAVCDYLSKSSNISGDEAAKLGKDDKIVEYASMISMITSALVIKMCRTYYTIVGIIIGIIVSLLFGYFMG